MLEVLLAAWDEGGSCVDRPLGPEDSDLSYFWLSKLGSDGLIRFPGGGGLGFF